MARKKPPSYIDPKDEYVRSPEPITVPALSLKWHKESRDGFSEGHLKKRCAREKWRDLRLEHWERARKLTTEKELDATADAHHRVIERYTRSLERVVRGAERYLDQFKPPPNTPAKERREFVPPYRDPGQAASAIAACMALAHKIRGLDIQKVADVTGDEVASTRYEDLSDAQLEDIIDDDDSAHAGGGSG